LLGRIRRKMSIDAAADACFSSAISLWPAGAPRDWRETAPSG
jgi:hypothetical protein